MPILGMCQIINGIIFIGFGYEIYFKGKYNLINAYVDGKLSETYAKKVGKIELAGGIASVCVGLIACIVSSATLAIVLVFACVICISVALIINQNNASKERRS